MISFQIENLIIDNLLLKRAGLQNRLNTSQVEEDFINRTSDIDKNKNAIRKIKDGSL
jgi:hypothetical protein